MGRQGLASAQVEDDPGDAFGIADLVADVSPQPVEHGADAGLVVRHHGRGVAAGDLDAAVGDPHAFVGAAGAQIAEVTRKVDALVAARPGAAAYTPAPIL